MATIATPTAAPPRRRSADPLGAPKPPPSSSPAQVSAASRQYRGRGGTVLFEVPFTSAMSDSDLARLARVLDLVTHTQPKMRPDPNSPGFALLDRSSGLYLEHGADAGHWILEARTWGDPAPQSVHEWHVLSAQAAQQLDRRVTLPERFPNPHRETTDRPLGRAASGRVASLHRRLVCLP
jgi:hypothetical protein